MTMKYAYCFSLAGTIAYSLETAESLRNRTSDASADDKRLIEQLIDRNRTGSFFTLETGELIFQQS